MSELNADLIKVIDENLPGMVSGPLKARLEKLDSLERSLKAANDRNDSLSAIIEKLRKFEDAEDRLNKKQRELDDKEAALKDQELRLKITKMEYELSAQRTIAENNLAVAMGLVRNVEYRTIVHGNSTDNTGGQCTNKNHYTDTTHKVE